MLPYRLQMPDWSYSEPHRLLHLIVTIPQENASLSYPFFRGVILGITGRRISDWEWHTCPGGNASARVVESGCKQFRARFAGAGMRWSRPGAENLIPIRAA